MKSNSVENVPNFAAHTLVNPYCEFTISFSKGVGMAKRNTRNSFVGRAQPGFQFTRETQKLKRINKNGVALSPGFNILRRSLKSCVWARLKTTGT